MSSRLVIGVVRWQAEAEVAEAEEQNELILLNVRTGVFYGLDSIGTRIWRLLRTPHTVDEITRVVCHVYGGTPETVYKDVEELLEQMHEALLVSRTCGD